MTGPGRNDPCPCGSGRKYKLCCLRVNDAIAHGAALLRTAEGTTVPTLLEFTATAYGPHLLDEAWQQFFDGVDVSPPSIEDKWFDALFIPWFLFEFVADPMRRRKRRLRIPHASVAAEYLETFPQKLNDSERQFLEAGLQTACSYHLVTGVSPGQSLDLEDLLTGDRHRVLERSASTTVRQGALLFARVVAHGESAIMSGCAPIVLPPLWRIRVAELRDIVFLRKRSGVDREDVRRASGVLLRFLHQAVDEIFNPAPVMLQNTDGDPLELITLRFTIRCSVRDAFDRLATLSLWRGDEAMEDPEYDKRGNLQSVSIDWSKRGNRLHKEWDNTTLGHLRIERDRLSASVNSRRRAARIRREIEKRLGRDASFTMEVHESIERAARARGKARSRDIPSEIDPAPPELQAQLEEMLARRWAQWLDDRIPALGDLTPRQAAKTASGREKLEALLADYEWHNASQPAHMRVDITRLREAVGLPVR